jgi:hypothetical protein|eukprot:CAMPEP_0174286948 /NCGR_PEP_ID=MMETSP0809-20121228/13840_1 /TAXON_ID=73025 ORGANISM="Eutreptiella gymnastica-like, Strain CCMP1594" /NCGR_SAMPLE_ID=MMETSP0809 /ASSEMBLY_ACC=CAM_ASM_000658 /LENGTH=456 /DNA_ID=CAMNT_0015383249 /DNA_START=34 /DNA_END=1404 /DNA_ORIENTATION=+
MMPERQGLASEQASYYTVPVDKQEWLWAMPRVCAAKVLIVMGMLLCCHPWIWPGFGPKQQATKNVISTHQTVKTQPHPFTRQGPLSPTRKQLDMPADLSDKMGPAVRGSVAAAGLGTAFQGPVSAEEVTAHPQVQILAEVSQIDALQILGVLLIFTAVVASAMSREAAFSPSPPSNEWDNPVPHPFWTRQQMEAVAEEHVEPSSGADWVAFLSSKAVRFSFDFIAGFYVPPITERKWLYRVVFLETIAGVPGMVAGLIRHFQSLRNLERDYGWIHTLLEDAENERMHLITFMGLLNPGAFFKGAVTVTQGVFASGFFLTYLVWPKLCHRFVGYVEEEAVHSYTMLLEQLDAGGLPEFSSMPCPDVGKRYWRLPEDATMRDLILAVRADEANHRLVQHTFASMEHDQANPFTSVKPGTVDSPLPEDPQEIIRPEYYTPLDTAALNQANSSEQGTESV